MTDYRKWELLAHELSDSDDEALKRKPPKFTEINPLSQLVEPLATNIDESMCCKHSKSTIAPLHERDDHAATSLLAAAFANYPAFAFIEPLPVRRTSFLGFYFKKWIHLCRSVPGARVLSCMCDTCGDILAVSIILPPKKAGNGYTDVPFLSQLKGGFFEVPFRFGPLTTARILRVLGSQASMVHNISQTCGTHWFQEYLAVDQCVQGKGLGSKFLRYQSQHIWRNGDVVILNTYAQRARKFYCRCSEYSLMRKLMSSSRLSKHPHEAP